MPTSLEMQGPVVLREITQLKLPVKLADRKLLKLCPMTNVDETDLIYEQRGVYRGVQNARGLGGQTGPARRPGVQSWRVSPGYYGDHWTLNEVELIRLREVGSWDKLKSYEKHLSEATEILTERFLNRITLSIASIITTGGFQSSDLAGRQFYQGVYNIPQFTPSILWDQFATATPFANIRDYVAQLILGKSVVFKDGVLLMSRPTFNLLMKNTNANDIGGKRLAVGANINNLDDVNKYLAADDLPTIEISDEDYYPEGESNLVAAPGPVRYIPNGKVVLIGRRKDGALIGEYRLTRAIQNTNSAPGEWFSVEDRRQYNPFAVTFRMGHNGGPTIYHPEALAIINAAAPF